MIGKKGKLMLFFYMIFLAILFLMCSTDLIIREPEKEIYQIAVIIEDVRDDNYSNFRKGMDQAAVEFNADVRFITLYEKQDADQQMELIGREQQDGADALIVMPVNEERVLGALSEKQVTVPVVLLGAELTGEAAAGTLRIDYRKMGEQLAGQMLHDMDEGCLVLALSDREGQSRASGIFLEGALSALDQGGCACQYAGWGKGQEEAELEKALENLAGKPAVLLAESPEILTEAAGILADNPLIFEAVKGLYGRGSTVQILNYLDRGLVTGICAADEFSTGYFCVRMAIQALEGLGEQAVVEMEPYYIQKSDLRDPAYEKLLFPIE